ncbi:MAG: MFS transporter, partial [Actinomycetota bacterium]|nr:MFS transporter [Actinomycetota bacterium]
MSVRWWQQARERGWLVLGVLGAAESLAFMDGLIVSVALPAIRQTFGFSAGQLQWVMNAYIVLMGGTLLVGGRLGDMFGRRRALVAGLTLFAMGALGSGLAPLGAVLLLGRGVQGVGAGLMLSASLALVTATFAEGSARQRALGVLAVLSGLAAVVGVVLGGLLTGLAGWRWVLLVNVPPAALVVWGARRWVPESSDNCTSARLDVVGSATVTAALLLVVYGIVQAEHGGLLDLAVIAPVAAGATLAVVVFFVERQVEDPVVPMTALRKPEFAAANMAGMLLPVGLGAVLFLVPLYFQTGLDLSPIATGLWLVPMATAIALVGPASSRAVSWLGR